MPLYRHFASRRRHAAIYTAITTTVADWHHCKSLLFAAINSRQVTSPQSLVSCIPSAQAAITITLQRCAFIYKKPCMQYIKPVKALPLVQYGKITLRHGLEPNIALGFTLCYISLSTMPSSYFFYIALAAVL